jgi:hypothetical protein
MINSHFSANRAGAYQSGDILSLYRGEFRAKLIPIDG